MNEMTTVEALVARWRDLADKALRRSGTWNGNDVADRIEAMADELEAAISALQKPEGREAAADRGPWKVSKHYSGVVISDDFDRDVALKISGDFRNEIELREYAGWLAGVLNTQPRQPTDTDRLFYLATDGCVEGFVGVEKDIYEFAQEAAEDAGREEPNDSDLVSGLRLLIDAAMGDSNV